MVNLHKKEQNKLNSFPLLLYAVRIHTFCFAYNALKYKALFYGYNGLTSELHFSNNKKSYQINND